MVTKMKGTLCVLLSGGTREGCEFMANALSVKALRYLCGHLTENLASEYPPRLMITSKNPRNRLKCMSLRKPSHCNPRGRSLPAAVGERIENMFEDREKLF